MEFFEVFFIGVFLSLYLFLRAVFAEIYKDFENKFVIFCLFLQFNFVNFLLIFTNLTIAFFCSINLYENQENCHYFVYFCTFGSFY